MIERQIPDRDPGLSPQTPPHDPEITTTGVNIQDVEHDARPETRVNNAGVKVPARTKEQAAGTEPDTAHDAAAEVEQQLKKGLTRLPPG